METQRREMLMPQKVLIVDDSIQLHKLNQGASGRSGFAVRFGFRRSDGGNAGGRSTSRTWYCWTWTCRRMDGFEVCRRLKADPGTVDIPIIFSDRRLLDRSAGNAASSCARWITSPSRSILAS